MGLEFTPWGWYWVAWIFVGFLPAEVYWIFVNAKNTLSDNFWALEHINRHHPFDFAEWTPVHWVFGIFLAVFLLWLLLHLVFGMLG